MQDFSSKAREIVNQNLEREFYTAKDEYPDSVEDLQDFRNLPTIRKEDAVDEDKSVMFEEMKDEAVSFNYTSGTTQHPTIVLLSASDMEIETEKALKQVDLCAGDRNYAVISSTIARRGYLRALKERDVLRGYSSPYNIGFSVRAITELEIDTLWTTPSLALKMGEMLSKKEHNVETIVLTGEPLSDLTRRKLKELYSEVDLCMDYGSIETGHLGYQCEDLQSTNRYHLYDDKFFYEILDFEGDKPVDQGYGELVTTKIWEDCYAPLIRYRSGDRAKWLESDCGCNELTIEVGGRTVFDSFKMSGFTLYREKFEDALDVVADLIGTTYQIHIKEVEEEGAVKPKLTVHLKPSESLEKDLIDRDEIAEDIAENFTVTDEHTYKDMRERGIFSPLDVVLKESIITDAKTKPVIDHRSD